MLFDWGLEKFLDGEGGCGNLISKTLREIAQLINGEIVGDADIIITGFAGIEDAKPGDITFVAHPKYFALAKKTKASAIVAPPEMSANGTAIIRAADPSLAFTRILSSVLEKPSISPGIHPTAIVSPRVKVGDQVSIGAYAVIEDGVIIGARTVIAAGCFIGRNTSIGDDNVIHPRVTLKENISIGQRVTINSGTVIGSDGFGFIKVSGDYQRIPHIGRVEIHDDVEIGSNVTIDRARLDKTIIGQGTKIDNLVQIAHNVQIGKHCIICSQVGIAGSSIIEDYVTLAGQVGIADHLTVGEGAIVASGSGVPSSLPPHMMYWGFPAKPHMDAKRVNACVQRLPHYVKMINDLKKKIEELEAKLFQK